MLRRQYSPPFAETGKYRTLGSPHVAAGKIHGFRTAHLHPLNAVVKPGAIDCVECQIDLAWSALKPASLSRLQQDTC